MKASLLRALSILAAFAIAGCAGGYKTGAYTAPMEMPGQYVLNAASAGRASDARGWWASFGDPELDSLIETAIANSPDVGMAIERIAQARAMAGISSAATGPYAGMSASAGRAKQQGMLGSSTSNAYSLGASVSYEIDAWGRLSNTAKAAVMEADATVQDVNAIFITFTADLAELYFTTVEQRQQLALLDQTIATYRDTLDRVDRRYRQGLSPATDVYQSRQNLINAEARRPLYVSRLKQTLNTLALMTGEFPDDNWTITRDRLPRPPEYGQGVPSELLQSRPDVSAAYLRMQGADHKVAASYAERFPSLTLSGSLGTYGNEPGDVLSPDSLVWSALIKAAAPLYDSGRIENSRAQTRAALRSSVLAYRKAVISAFTEVRNALLRNENTAERIKLLQSADETSASTLDVSMQQYMQGLTDYLPVMTAQQQQLSVRSVLIEARRQLISDRIYLARVLGGQWPAQRVINKLDGKEVNSDER